MRKRVYYDGIITEIANGATISGISSNNLTGTNAVEFLSGIEKEYGGKYTSDESGAFSTTAKMTISLLRPYTLNGFILNVPFESGECRISVSSNIGQWHTVIIENGVGTVDLNETDVSTIWVDFLKITPNTALYVNSCRLGYTEELQDLESTEADLSSDFSGRTFPISTFKAGFSTYKLADIYLPNHTVSLYIDDVLYGMFYIEKAEKSGRVITLSCKSPTAQLEAYTYEGTTIRHDAARQQLNAVLDYIFDNQIPQFDYTIELESANYSPIIPYVFGTIGFENLRTVLHHSALGSCRYILDDLKGHFTFTPLKSSMVPLSQNINVHFNDSSVISVTIEAAGGNKYDTVNGKELRIYAGTTADAEDIWTDEVYSSENITIRFSEPHTTYRVYRVTESGGEEVRTQIDTATYLPTRYSYMVVFNKRSLNGKFVITGQKLKISDFEFGATTRYKDNPTYDYSTLELKDVKIQAQHTNSLTNYIQFSNVSTRLLKYLQAYRLKMDVALLDNSLNDVKRGTAVDYIDGYGNKFKGYVERIKTSFNGLASLEIVGGYI